MYLRSFVSVSFHLHHFQSLQLLPDLTGAPGTRLRRDTEASHAELQPLIKASPRVYRDSRCRTSFVESTDLQGTGAGRGEETGPDCGCDRACSGAGPRAHGKEAGARAGEARAHGLGARAGEGTRPTVN